MNPSANHAEKFSEKNPELDNMDHRQEDDHENHVDSLFECAYLGCGNCGDGVFRGRSNHGNNERQRRGDDGGRG